MATCLLPFSRSWRSSRCVADGALRFRDEEELFSTAEYLVNIRLQYDVSPDDQSFLMLRYVDEGAEGLVYMQPWPSLLEGRR